MILVVDDNPAVLRSVARCLRGAGYEVLTAASAERAVELVEKHGSRVDTLLTDVVMKDCTGLQLANALGLSHPALKVVFMTGHVGPSARSELTRIGGAQVLLKPFDQGRLLRELRELTPPGLPPAGPGAPGTPAGGKA